MFTLTATYPTALLAGLLAFFSPCVLPLLPAYFTFITGYSLEELTGEDSAGLRLRVLITALVFTAGFSFVFVVLGASASYLGGLMHTYRGVIRIVGGGLIILLGIHMLGWIRIGTLQFDRRVHLKSRPLHLAGTFVVGMAFAAGWSPCIGPLLGSILILAGNQQTVGQGVLLLAVFSAGLAAPFIFMALCINFILAAFKKLTKVMRFVNPVAGLLLIAAGIALMADLLSLG